MHRAFIATALAFSLHSAQAAEAHAATVPAAGMVQASLGGLATPQAASRKDATNAPPPAMRQAAVAVDADEDGEQDHSTAMLLAALVLMAGIALRRWGTAQP